MSKQDAFRVVDDWIRTHVGWTAALIEVAGFSRDFLDGRHHGCEMCGQGKDCARFIDAEAGAVFCGKCFWKNNGDGISATAHKLNISNLSAARKYAEHYGIPLNSCILKPAEPPAAEITIDAQSERSPGPGIIGLVAKTKGLLPEDLFRFGARPAYRGDLAVARIPVVDETGNVHSYFDMPREGKGLLRPGKGSAGLFAPFENGQPQLPQVDETWLIVEGVKDAAALAAMGYQAIGLPTCKMAKKYAKLFAGCHIVIVPDRDQAGEDGARETASRLAGVATSIRIAALPGEIKSRGGDDVRDVIKSHGQDVLRRCIEQAEEFLPGEAEQETPLDVIGNALQVGDEIKPLPMDVILRGIWTQTNNWPKRCAGALFVDNNGEVAWLDTASAIFGWIQSATGKNIHWHRRVGCISRDEVAAELRRRAEGFAAVETMPHCPPIKGHYYACQTPQPGDGSHLNKLIDQFSPATDVDRDLIEAMFVTPMWGGPCGCRPAFLITSDFGRGVGKSSNGSVLARLYGGSINVAHGEDVVQIKARLLSPDSMHRRIAMLDNIKTTRFSWGEFEALITSPEISGKKMYVGDASRPNSFTWILTLNGASLSTDMAQRTIPIKLARPNRRADWEESTGQFVDEHREAIFADIAAFYLREPWKFERFSRWASWEQNVLARVSSPGECQKVIQERQGETDCENEEIQGIEEFFAQQLANLHYDVATDRVHIPGMVAAKWFSEAVGDRVSQTTATRRIRQMASEESIKRLGINPSHTNGRGILWTGQEWESSSTIYDLESRVNFANR